MLLIAATLMGAFVALFGGLGDALAEVPQQLPKAWALNYQDAASPVMHEVERFHNLLMWVITLITIFVLALLVYVMVRFRASANPVPSKTSHHTLVEVVWTVVPILILVVIAVPSFKLLYYGDKTKEAGLTIKAIGKQWFWTYEYPDNGNFTFDAIMVPEKDLKPGQPRLLETDNTVVVPVDTNVRLLVTAADVIHAWAMPAFGVKKDGVPGRLNETWFRADREGLFYGQCSEICGAYHGYMPIKLQVVSKEAFAKWAEEAKQKFASVDGPSPRLAAADATAQ
ncbi:cytochrome c oxidase subunit II [Ferrovibrio sp.]|uniref:cytochrome c oxidase subunit II n=1 Tax=Ferrovibrio sp. TaxID=1917215 RepID=UPI001B678BDC|nr:cytochrome c oxidase subunit II [Ferrovibrio sp.]MBP7064538.1 cytochrome c oxidase subunit II [Ferrovibrio sp.]